MTSLLKSFEADSIQFGSKKIHYSIIRSNRKTLAISVHPDLKVVVTSPVEATFELIQNRIRKRAPWIIKQKVYFSDFLPLKPSKQFVSGETFYYLGKQYRLKVRKGNEQVVVLKGQFILVSPDNFQNVKRLVTCWFKEKARQHFEHKIETWWPKISKLKTSAPKLMVKPMKKRWGSFTQNKRIILNTELIEAPSQCIEYVVVHELCHAHHQNHSRAFFNLLSKVMPDWEKRKEQLEKF